MCSVVYTHPQWEEYALIMKADEIFFFAFVVILSPQKFSTLPTTKSGLFLGLVKENKLVLCEVGLEVLGDN
jgi:hypothetical protein